MKTAPRLWAGTVDPALAAAIAPMGPGEEVAVVVSLADRLPLGPFAPRGSGRLEAQGELVRALKAKAALRYTNTRHRPMSRGLSGLSLCQRS